MVKSATGQPRVSRITPDGIATALTILTCIAVLGYVGVQALARKSSPTAPALQVGATLGRSDGVVYAPRGLTVLVGLSSTCRYCAESVPAFQSLNTFASANSPDEVRVFALAPEPLETIARYLSANGLTAFRAVTVDRGSTLVAAVSRTPTMLVVNSSGKILLSWTGRMTAREMADMIDYRMNLE